MKKLIPIVLMISSEENTHKPSEFNFDNQLNSTCTAYFQPLDSMGVDDQVSWLRQRQSTIVSTHLSCIEGFHKIPKGDYDDMLRLRWPNVADTKYTGIILGDLLQYECNYNNYLCFESDAYHRISFKPIPNFATSKTCYSIPLFHSIIRNNPTLTENSILRFTKAEYSGNEVIVFNIDGLTDGYFDYSRIPRLIDEKNPI